MAESLQSYRDLLAWQKAVDLVEAIYKLSETLPVDERFGLVSQMRRAATSVPANIDGGYGRHHRGDYIHHLSIANGSLKEVKTHLIVAGRLNYIDREQARPSWDLTQEVGKLLAALRKSLQS